VLQVVQAASASGSTTTSTSMADVTNSSVSITPSNACNSVRFKTSMSANSTNSAATNNQFYYQFLRGATNISGTDWFAVLVSSGSGGGGVSAPVAYEKLDWPQSASALTYKTQHRCAGLNSPSLTTSSITAIAEEVMA
jgi:hypothetical protein